MMKVIIPKKGTYSHVHACNTNHGILNSKNKCIEKIYYDKKICLEWIYKFLW